MVDKPVNVYPTMLSTLLHELQELAERYGDMPVLARGWDHTTSQVVLDRKEYYYDGGGGLHPTVNTQFHCQHWERTKRHPEHPWLLVIYGAEPEPFYSDVDTGPPYTRDTIDGEPVRDRKGEE